MLAISVAAALACTVPVSGSSPTTRSRTSTAGALPAETSLAPPATLPATVTPPFSPTGLAGTPDRTPIPTATLPPGPAPTAVAGNCRPTGNDSLEDQLIALMNQERANRGIGPLAEQSALTAAARLHSADMACNDFFSHTGSDGSSPFDRMARSGYRFSAAAENLGAGHQSAQEIFAGWMESQGHHDNLLNPAYVDVGIGYVFHSDSQYGGYWTGDFGAP